MTGWFIVTFLCGAVVGAAYGVYLEHRCEKMLNVAEGLLQSASEAKKKTTDNLEKAIITDAAIIALLDELEEVLKEAPGILGDALLKDIQEFSRRENINGNSKYQQAVVYSIQYKAKVSVSRHGDKAKASVNRHGAEKNFFYCTRGKPPRWKSGWCGSCDGIGITDKEDTLI